MIIKGIALTALVASTPLALFATQDPIHATEAPAAAAQQAEKSQAEARRIEAELQSAKDNLRRARAELRAAQQDLTLLGKQLHAALDRLDGTVEPQPERNCSPSRNRMLMSHFQWLRDQGHQQRAGDALAKVVKQVGDDANRLNSVAWDLMTDKETAGKFDDVALALTQRLEQVQTADKGKRHIDHNHLDTAALANFLNGQVDAAVRLQQQAIAKGGNGDDFRRRLRTYEVAQAALAKAARAVALPTATMVAANEEDEE
jgi:hypothetical protein